MQVLATSNPASEHAALVAAGRAQLAAGRLAEAEALYCLAQALAPEDPEILHALGLIRWQAGALVEDSNTTIAEGLATRTAFELPQRILRDLLDDFVLVSDAGLAEATRLMIEKTRNLVEPAGAAALAAVLADPARFAGRNVAVVCSGGNISPAQLTALWPAS